jgi:hypothetical protein
MVDAFFSEQFGVIGRVQHAIKIEEEVFSHLSKCSELNYNIF